MFSGSPHRTQIWNSDLEIQTQKKREFVTSCSHLFTICRYFYYHKIKMLI